MQNELVSMHKQRSGSSVSLDIECGLSHNFAASYLFLCYKCNNKWYFFLLKACVCIFFSNFAHKTLQRNNEKDNISTFSLRFVYRANDILYFEQENDLFTGGH